jgi:hypothetical protein
MNDLLFIVICGFILSSFLLFISMLTILYFFKKKLEPVLYMALMWVFYLMWVLCFLIGLLVSDTTLFKQLIFLIGSYTLIPAGYMGLLSGEILFRDKIRPLKLLIFTILSTLLVISPFYESIWSVLRHYPVILAINFRKILWDLESIIVLEIIIRLIFSFNWIQFFYHGLIRYKEIPEKFKIHGIALRISIIILGILTPSLFWFINIPYILGIVFISLSVGILCLIVIHLKHSALLHFVPIRVLRLTIMELNSGRSVYTYSWDTRKDIVDDDLFASMLKGINSILNESLRSGTIQEIDLEEGVLIFKRIQETEFITFLIALRSSKILKRSLTIFNKKFYSSYNEYLNSYWDRENFMLADNIIREVFSYLLDLL